MIQKYEQVSSANERLSNRACAFGQQRATVCATIIRYGGGQNGNARVIILFLLARFLHYLL